MAASKQLYDSLDWLEIARFVTDLREENLHLEFKTAKADGRMASSDDKKNFSSSLSGFLNSDGGIVVWGISAKKNADEVDCANAIIAIERPDRMVSRLNELTGEATSPVSIGVQHKAIYDPTGSLGVVATFVPESDGGPFMAKLGENRYYKRSGDSFYVMEHFDLADMFGRRRRPKLTLKLKAEPVDEGTHLNVLLFLANTGRASAKHTGFFISVDNATVVESWGVEDVSSMNSQATVTYVNNVAAFHPNGLDSRVGSVKLKPLLINVPIKFTCRLYCDDMELDVDEIELNELMA